MQKNRTSLKIKEKATFSHDGSGLISKWLREIRKSYPNRTLPSSLGEVWDAAMRYTENLVCASPTPDEQLRFVELKIHVKQDANRRIPPGRDPGSGGAW
ncbi:MAG: hypothetical protein AAF478_12570 [Pseudomonadota bacterium]